jgi:hypothetical protein
MKVLDIIKLVEADGWGVPGIVYIINKDERVTDLRWRYFLKEIPRRRD